MTFETLSRIQVRFRSDLHQVELRPLRYRQLPGYIMDRALRHDATRDWLRAELALVVAIDGKQASRAEIDELCADAEVLAGIVAARARLYSWSVEQGRIHAICPVCGEAVLDGPLLATPKLASPTPPDVDDLYGERPVAMRGLAPRPASPAKAARIEVVFPSLRCGFSETDDPVAGTLGDIDVVRERDAWRTYGPIGKRQPMARVDWTYDEAWFRAALRLMVAMTELRDRSGAVLPTEPERITWMWLADVQFLDAVYTATHDLAVEDVDACTVRCSAGHPFLPVR